MNKLIVIVMFLTSLISQQQVSELYNTAIQYRADQGSLHRFYTITNSPERRDRLITFNQNLIKKVEALDFDQLSQDGKIDYILMINYSKGRLKSLETEKEEMAKIRDLVSYGDVFYELEKDRRRGLTPNGYEIAGKINDALKKLEAIKSKLEKNKKKKYPRNLIRRAVWTVKGHEKALKSVYEFYERYNADFTWWVGDPYVKALEAFEAYIASIEKREDTSLLPKDDGSGIIGNPIGRKAVMQLLKENMIPYTPEELIDIAEKEFAWSDRELLKASEEMGFGKDWRAAQEKVKMSFVPAGEQPEAMLELHQQSIDFISKHDLLNIPPIADETWRMSMISPERQRISPFFLGGEVLQISYPTDDMTHDEKLMSMRGNNPHFSRAVVHHEIIAGHHLQGFMSRRHQSYRYFGTPFWGEGWALYWELLLWDKGFPRGPEDKIGMLFWRMHRSARIIFSLNYHLGKWSPQQCIDYLVDRVGHERSTAEAEVRRSFTGGYGPLYQIAYMIGGLQFRSLSEELVGSGKMTYKEFHDAVLMANRMPVEMVRALLTNQKLDKDFKTSWRFYD